MLRWIGAQRYEGLIEIEHEPRAEALGERRLLERLRSIDDAI
jgi:hypothetical protein